MPSANLKSKNGHFYAVISCKDETTKTGYKNRWIAIGDDEQEANRLIAEHCSGRRDLLKVQDVASMHPNKRSRLPRRKPLMLSEAIPKFFDFVANHRSPATLEHAEYALRGFTESLKHDMDIRLITASHLDEYYASQRTSGMARDTIAGRGLLLNRFFNFLIHKKLIEHNPVKQSDRPSPNRNRYPRCLTDEQVEYIYEIIKKNQYEFSRIRNKLLITLMVKTGLRRGEVARLTWDRIDLKQRRLLVERGKGDRDGWVPISQGLAEDLTNYPYRNLSYHVICTKNGKQLKGNGIRLIISKMARHFKKKFPEARLYPHGLRHTFASRLARRGMPIQKIQLAMRHKTVEMTMRYAFLQPDSIQEDINLID